MQEELELLKTLILPGTLDDYMAKLEEEQEKYRASEIERLDDEHATVVMEERYLFLIYTDDTVGTFQQKVSSRSSEHQFKSKSSNIIIEFQGEVNTGFLLLSAKKGEIQYPNEETITVLKNTSGGALSVISADDSIASASIEGDIITVTPKLTNKDGKRVTITVTSEPVGKYKKQMAKYIATIKRGSITIEATPYEGEFDGQRHPAISNVNVTPEDAKVEYSLNGGEYQEEIPEVEMTGEYTVTIKAEKEGYESLEITKTVTINKQGDKNGNENPNLVITPTSGTITYPTPETFKIVKNTSGGKLSVSSSDEGTVIASIEGDTVTLTPQAIGANTKIATITVTAQATENYEKQTATYIATVIGNRTPVFAQDSTITKTWNTSTLTTNFTVTARATDEDKDDTLTYTVYMKPATSADSEYKAVGTSAPTVQGQNATINITQYNGANLGSYTEYNWKVGVSDGKTTEPVEEEKTNTNKIRTYCRTYNCTSGNTTTVNCTTCSHTGKVNCTTCGATGRLTTNCTTCNGTGKSSQTQKCNGVKNVWKVEVVWNVSGGACMDCSTPEPNCRIYAVCSTCGSGASPGGPVRFCGNCAQKRCEMYSSQGSSEGLCGATTYLPCTACSGTGKARCTNCSGTGKAKCSSCSGRGYNYSYNYCPSHHIASSHWYCGHSNNTNANYHD